MSSAQKSSVETNIYFHRPTDAERSLKALRRNDLLSKLAGHGVVLLRGFDTNINAFSALVNRITPQTAIDPAREFFAKNVQLVDSGVHKIGLHCENGTTPLVPEIVWFYCERAALRGSQTTICDGRKVWKHLSPRARDLFRSNRIRFARNVKNELWLKYVKHHFPHLASETKINQKMLDEIFGHISGSNIRINDDGSLFLSHAAFAAHPTFFGNDLAFANSLFGPSYNYEAPKICFENGNSIPDWLLLEARAKTELITAEIPWMSGDIILIDNSRFMHGRRQILDTNRKLFTALGFLSVEDSALAHELAEHAEVVV
jgi:alpha-ketoglutarate-dependent taurine dioxygenase